jgi:cyanate permease
MSALFIGFGGEAWRVPYYIIGAIFMLSIIVFGVIVFVSRRFAKINGMLDKKYIQPVNGKANAMNDEDPLITLESKKKTTIFYIVDLIMVCLITSLYHCVMNYITSLLVEVHGLPQDISIYVSVIAPIAIAFGPMMTITSCDHHKDFIRQGLLFTLIVLPVPVLLALFYKANLLVALVLSVIFVVLANGIKAIGLSVMTFKMRKVMNAGAYSAISNAVASIAAGVTPTIIGKIIDSSGWAAAYWVTFAVCVVIAVALFVIDIIVRKEYRKAHNLKQTDNI